MKTGIYKITNLINGKFYIGSAVDFDKRWNTHKHDLRNNKHHSSRFQNAWNKYQEENFEFLVIEEVQDKEKLIEREQYYLDTLKPEYNICKVAGSWLGNKHSEETKKIIREKRKLQTITEETRQKMSEVQKNRIVSEETKQKMRGKNNPFYGKKHSQETKQKMSENHRDYSGKNNPNFGKHPSEETRQKMSEARKGQKSSSAKLTWEKVREIRAKYIPETYSLKMLAKEYNVDKSTILDIIHFNIWKEEINET